MWVPADANNMFMCTSETAADCDIKLVNDVPTCVTHDNNTQMAGRFYTAANSVRAQSYTTNNSSNYSNNEPMVSGYSESTIKSWVSNGILKNPGYENLNNFIDLLHNEYNQNVKSVLTYGGFYIGRYETSNIGANKIPKAIAGILPANSVNWTNFYAYQKMYINSKGCLGGMITGAAWGQTMKFVNSSSYNAFSSGNAEHSLSSAQKTGGVDYSGTEGFIYKDVAKNIYDLEGNVTEFSLGARSSNPRTYGSRYNSSNSAAYTIFYSNNNYTQASSLPSLGSRLVVFMK